MRVQSTVVLLMLYYIDAILTPIIYGVPAQSPNFQCFKEQYYILQEKKNINNNFRYNLPT